jgi:tight adherence protein C
MSGEIWIFAAFFTFVLAAVSVSGYVVWMRTARGPRTQTAGIPVELSTEPSRNPTQAVLVDVFRSIGENFPGAKAEKNPHRKQLWTAGYRWPSAVAVFYGIKCGAALLLAGVVGIVALAMKNSGAGMLLPLLCAGAFGFMIPDRVLASRIRSRTRRLRSALPPALDLMILGLEAGQSLDQSIADASRGLRRTHPELSAELAQLYMELGAGHLRADAFRNLAIRTGEPELRKLSNLLIDSDRFGSSLAPALKTHAKYLRARFRQQAQEAARKVGVKLIFPVFFLIFPSVLLVTLGPACIMMYTQLQVLLK